MSIQMKQIAAMNVGERGVIVTGHRGCGPYIGRKVLRTQAGVFFDTGKGFENRFLKTTNLVVRQLRSK